MEQIVQVFCYFIDKIILEHLALARVQQLLPFLNDRHHAVAQISDGA